MKTFLPILSLLAAITLSAHAAPPQPETDLHKTLSAASQQQKLAFVLLGRATCSNCNATKAMIREAKIPVTDTHYVMADLNIDDPKTQGEFMRKFGHEKFGDTLPFVVVTDSQGKVLASSGGYKDATQWDTLLASARHKVASAPAAANPANAADANWPFKTAVQK